MGVAEPAGAGQSGHRRGARKNRFIHDCVLAATLSTHVEARSTSLSLDRRQLFIVFFFFFPIADSPNDSEHHPPTHVDTDRPLSEPCNAS